MPRSARSIPTAPARCCSSSSTGRAPRSRRRPSVSRRSVASARRWSSPSRGTRPSARCSGRDARRPPARWDASPRPICCRMRWCHAASCRRSCARWLRSVSATTCSSPTCSTPAAATLAGLRAIVGVEHAHDGGAAVDGITPRWTAAPATTDQAAALIALAYDERLAVVPRGGGTALELGHPLTRVDLVVDMRRLDAVLEYQPEDLTVTVQAGCTAGMLAARLASHRQLLPLDPPGWAVCSLGGLAATQATGPLRHRYGAMRDLLLGVRFAQADGVLTWGGAKV